MTEFNFDNIDDLVRDEKLEGETGVSLKIKEGFYLLVRAATDANPLWRAHARKALAEARRLENTGAPKLAIRKVRAGLYTTAIVFGWHGGVDETTNKLKPGGPTINGEFVDFSSAACLALLTKADDCITAIEDHCFDTQNFRAARAQKIIDTVGN